MNKKLPLVLIFSVAFIFLVRNVSAHCPLCAMGAGAAAVGAVWLGISKVVVGLFIGALLPFIFSSLCMSAVGSSAHKIVVEVRRQFREIKGLMSGKEKPEYGKCVDIVTKAALKNMILPALIAVLAPLIVGMLLGIEALGGLLIGVILSGLLMALFMSNTGAAWDNAKKLIEKEKILLVLP